MKPHFDQIIHHVSLAVASHYTTLADNLAHSARDDTQRIKALVNVRTAQIRDNELIEDFSDLIARYYPELAPTPTLEELHSL